MPEKKSALRWIAGAVQKSKYGVLALLVLQGLNSAASVVFALFLKNVIDRVTSGDGPGFWLAVIKLALLILFLILDRALIRRCDEATRGRMENALKQRAYEACLTRSYAALTTYHTGDLLTRLTSDTNAITNGLVSVLPGAAAMVIKFIGAASVLFALDYRFTLILVAGGLVLLAAAAALRRTLKRLHKLVQERDGTARSYLQETLGHLLILRAFGAERTASETAANYMEDHYRARMHRNIFSCVGNAGMSLIVYAGYLFGLVWCGVGILHGALTYGTLTAVLELVSQLQSPFVGVSGYLPAWYAALASAERLMELESLPGEDLTGRLTAEERGSLYEKISAIRAEDLTFTYPGGAEPVLEHASLEIPRGSFIALTGRSGIGKSTLLKLLLSIYLPEQGSLTVACADGTSRTLTPALRPLFAYVPQGSFLMSGTIADAVSFSDGGKADPDRLRAACRIACADFMDDLPDGLNTRLGEGGAGLSEGQLQRLSIARAVYSGAPILLLDEATSALDADTEAAVLRNLRNLTDKTVLIITHRPAALAVCDRAVSVADRRFTC